MRCDDDKDRYCEQNVSHLSKDLDLVVFKTVDNCRRNEGEPEK